MRRLVLIPRNLVGICFVTLTMLLVLSTAVSADTLAEKNLFKEVNGSTPDIAEIQSKGTTGDFTTPYPTTAEGDSVVTAGGPWSWWWHPGDYALGNRATSLGAVNRLDYHMVIAVNGLNGTGHCDIEFHLNGILIGGFTVLPGDSVRDFSFTFNPIPGPNYELHMVETNLVEFGKGSFLLDSSLPGSVTLFEAEISSINGHVTDATTGAPLGQALVIAIQQPTKMKTKTAGDGSYQISGIPPGTWWVLAWKPGYKFSLKTVTLGAGETKTVDFSLTPKSTSSRDDEIPPKFREAINAAPALSSQHKLTTTWGAIKMR